jgi:GTP-binding protein
MPTMHISFLTSAAHPSQFPGEGPPEIAFLGRSNVGKSSLLNSLAGTPIARVSSTPGRTRTINFFDAHLSRPERPPDLRFADLPGYGYARLPKALLAGWPKFIEPYLEHRATLALCIVLVDVNVPPQKSDAQLIRWMRAKERPFLIVATKTDRLSANQLRNSLRDLRAALAAGDLLPYSARTDAGRSELWRVIRHAARGFSRTHLA